MSVLATVLYEDSMQAGPGGSYPLHDLVMRLVEDDINGQTWRLHKLVEKNPRRGVGNILNDVKVTSLLAGAGELYLLIDRDQIARHLGLSANASDDDVVAEIRKRSDAPDKLRTFFLYPNIEGLLKNIQGCDPTLLPENVESALQKKLNDRDIVLNEVKKASMKSLRDCLRKAQPGLEELVASIATRIRGLA